ncbi:MAG TPA: cysteine synthase A [Alloiococcus sp.]|nr:cysteine synthase A [Alloiococcus sp.]
MLYNNIIDAIGNTPLVKLNHVPKEYADIYVKLEFNNPGGSVKDRPVRHIIKNLLRRGVLKPGGTIVEYTSGNTGIALAMVGAALDLNVIIVMPETMSKERKLLMKAYGAELVLTPGEDGVSGAQAKAEEIAKEKDAPIFGQFSNEANVRAHEETTAMEILADLPDVDGFVAGVGTGGTVTGVGHVLKATDENITVWAVEPKDSPLLSGGEAGPHKIQGLGANFIPEILDRDVYDHVFQVSNEEAMSKARELAKTEGILGGISSGANLTAAFELAKELGKGQKVVTVLPSNGERYLSTPLYEHLEDELN